METALIICRCLHFTALMLLAGGTVLFPMLLGKRAVPGFWRPLRIGLAIVVALTAVAWLDLLAVVLAGDWGAAVDPAVVGSVLFDTQFGHLWVWRLGLSLALVLGAAWPWSAGILALPLLASLALTGHAIRETGLIGVLHVANQMVHLVAAGLWLGGLGVLAVVLADSRRKEVPPLERALRRFSGIGYGAVAGILATGIVNIRFVMDGAASFLNTSYGIVLLVKIILVLSMVALALANRFVLTPALGSMPDSARKQLGWSVGIEFALGLAVLAVVSLLGTMSPPSDGMG
jgi:putative copper resistance protein D